MVPNGCFFGYGTLLLPLLLPLPLQLRQAAVDVLGVVVLGEEIVLGFGLFRPGLLGGGLGIAVYAAAAVAAVCIALVLGGFVNAYYMTSFIGMYETLSAPPAMGQEDTTQL